MGQEVSISHIQLRQPVLQEGLSLIVCHRLDVEPIRAIPSEVAYLATAKA
jgi:hypothetical protein